MNAEIAFRLLLTAFLSILPTLLFLGLWRGLSKLRDDALLDHIETVHGVDPRPNLRAVIPGISSTDGPHGRCNHCGSVTEPSASVCRQCS